LETAAGAIGWTARIVALRAGDTVVVNEPSAAVVSCASVSRRLPGNTCSSSSAAAAIGLAPTVTSNPLSTVGVWARTPAGATNVIRAGLPASAATRSRIAGSSP
jgi:hypothetical protein